MSRELEGQVALVTGASRGVGYYMALELAKAGADIVVAARSEQVWDPKLPGTIYTAADDIRRLGQRVLPMKVDVAKDEEVDAAIKQTLSEFGRIDILVNNAGIMFPGNLVDVPIRRWDLIWKVNVRGLIYFSQQVLPVMIAQRRGTIINISSRGADNSGAGNISYSVTKQAIRKFSEGLAGEVKVHDVKVFALSPDGLVPSPGATYHGLDTRTPPERIEATDVMGSAAVYLAARAPMDLSGQHFYSQTLLRDLAPA
ncbi:MAG: SDR family NAD(P)-dependent oxidoreductase [Dehalococcoidia bacterium]